MTIIPLTIYVKHICTFVTFGVSETIGLNRCLRKIGLVPQKYIHVIIAPPGRKKSPLHKIFMQNIKQFIQKDTCYRNHEKCNILDVMWGNGTCEAMKSSLSDRDGCAIIHSNEFNTVLNDLDRFMMEMVL